MFGRICRRCGNKPAKGDNFCPKCGNNIKAEENERDFGLLGRDDNLDFGNISMGMPFGFNRLFSSLLKQINGQFRELDKEIGKETEQNKAKLPKMTSSGLSVSISSSSGKQPEIRVRGFGPGFENIRMQEGRGMLEGRGIQQDREEMKEAKTPQIKISEEKARKLAKLPKQEPETQVRRLSNKIVYEINLPEVKKLEDVIINKLENSIEIKAFSKNKAYFKLLPLNLPILNYKLEKEKLILELKAK